jgi:Tol biopolymer transport system component
VSSLSVSDTGTIVYHTARPRQPNHFVWFDRSGRQIGDSAADATSANGAALSSDGQRLAQLYQGDIWIRNFTTGTDSRFTFDPAVDTFPLWSLPGDRIVFSSNRKGTFDPYAKPADGSATEEALLVSDQSKAATDWSADGRLLLYRTIDPKNRYDIWVLPFDGDKKPFPLVQTKSDDLDAQFSPDAKFIAHQSNRTGRYEIYVERFHASGIWQVSSEGGAPSSVATRRQGTLLPCIGRPADVGAHSVNRRDLFSGHSGAAVYDPYPPRRHATKHEPAVIHGVPGWYALLNL